MTIVLGLSLYTWVMIAFLVLLLIVLVLGDIGDLGFDSDVGADIDTGLSPLSLPIIAGFGTAFGGFGTLFEMREFGPFFPPPPTPARAVPGYRGGPGAPPRGRGRGRSDQHGRTRRRGFRHGERSEGAQSVGERRCWLGQGLGF